MSRSHATMIDDIEPDHAGGFYRAGVWLYALAIVYVSIVVTKDGFDFVPRDLGEAWHGFVNMPYLIHGSDQQQDWMANLLMFGGFGFLLAGTQARGGRLRTVHGLTALVICVAFLLTVKYAQLFFPPRTVSINYVLAQTGGSIIGIAAYALLHRRLARLAAAFARGGRRALIALSAIYTGFLFAFWLVLSGHYTTKLIVVGAVCSLLCAWAVSFVRATDQEGHPVHLLGRTVTFYPWLAWEIAKSAWAVTKLLLNPSLPISPTMTGVRAGQRTTAGIATYANSITLTPGTISVDLGENAQRERVLYIHNLTLGDPEEFRMSVKNTFERLLLRVTRGRDA